MTIKNKYFYRYTHYASILLFAYFGFRLLSEAIEMYRNPSVDKNEELKEVEQELGGNKDDIESGRSSPTVGSLNLTVLTQAFTLTFLAGKVAII